MNKNKINKAFELINKLKQESNLLYDEILFLLNQKDNELVMNYISEQARDVSKKYFYNKIYIRGLIEFSNYCKNNCFYCGIRKNNLNIDRYRLTQEEILKCCETGYNLGFRTFVLQSGEDLFFDDNKLINIILEIKKKFSDCALTLSIGEKSFEQYKKYFDAGADRFLLRHETLNYLHYKKLHPEELSFSNRIKCLYNLKKIGYQVGTGCMIGSPYQTLDNIIHDLFFIKKFKPEMIGIGPFIAHKDTRFFDFKSGDLNLSLILISILRLMLPNALIPATTSLGTINNQGREKGILYGANVLMPNLSPVSVRKKYELYNNKICTGEEAAECITCLKKRLEKIGYEIIISRGDFKKI